MIPFGDRLAAAMDEYGPLCVGIDPHPSLLQAWGLEDSAESLRTFAMNVYEDAPPTPQRSNPRLPCLSATVPQVLPCWKSSLLAPPKTGF